MKLIPCYIIHNPFPNRTIRQVYTDLKEAKERMELENSIEGGNWSVVTAFISLPELTESV